MAHLIYILFVVFYRRTLLSILVLALAWDFYYAGPKDSVFLYGVLTLSERALEGSKHFPEFMDQAYDTLNAFYQSLREASAAFLNNDGSTTTFAQAPSLDEDVTWALSMATLRTGVPSGYLAKLARLESGYDAKAMNSTKDRAGLYGIKGQTWLALIDAHGAAYGKGGFAHDVDCDEGGNCAVATPARQREVLDLRFDGMTSTFFVAELTRTHMSELETKLVRSPNQHELYLAFLLGVNGAHKFITALEEAPFTTASNLFPQAARVHKKLFYGPLGSKRTLSSIDALLAERWTTCEEGDTLMAHEPETDAIPTS